MLAGMPGPASESLIALGRRREQIIELLSERFAGGVLDVEEFERRIDLAHRADRLAALEELAADLEPASAAPPVQALAVRSDASMAVARPHTRRTVAFMGALERRGSWRVPERLAVYTVMGSGLLDFRECVLPPGETLVQVRAVMGSVEIIVPPQLAVECEGIGVMGAFELMDRVPAQPDPDRPLLRITGLALMGAVSVETRLPGESARQARKRRRRERHAQLGRGEP
jgi:hypothetical protein